MIFSRDTFGEDLINNVLTPKHSLVAKTNYIASKVYSGGTLLVTDKELAKNNLSHYGDFLYQWGLGVHNERLSIYTLNPVSGSDIRTYMLRKWQKDHHTFSDSLEIIVSVCIACGMDFAYTRAAAKAYCNETFEGKGIRKALIYGAARGFYDFSSIACRYDGGEIKFGMLERYYEALLTEQGHCEVSNDDYDDTGEFIAHANECETKEQFLTFINEPMTRRGALYDSVELIKTVEGAVDARKKNQAESDRSLFMRCGVDNLRSTYSNFCRGHVPGESWFLAMALGFGFTADEVDAMAYAAHFNSGRDDLFHRCADLLKQLHTFEEGSDKYRAVLSVLMTMDGGALENRMPSFYRLLQSKL